MTTRLQLRRSLAVTAAICAISAPAAGAEMAQIAAVTASERRS